jgi:hypothetical protein
MEHDRYVLDREYQEEEERFRQLAPYYKSMGLRRKRPATKKNTKTVPNRKKKLNSRVLHTKGVDWELFLKDVTGMCDAAVACESKVTGGSGTISVTASKIKEVCGAAMTRENLLVAVAHLCFAKLGCRTGFRTNWPPSDV